MQVFLIRHAEAVDETLAVRDPHRVLTLHGRVQARSLGDRLRWHDCLPTHVWASPFVRTVQTAELVAAGLHSSVAVDVVPALAPDGDARAVVSAIRALAHGTAIVLVGHEPALSAVGALLVGNLAFDALGKAEAARIVDGSLRWRFAWNSESPDR